MPRNHDATKHTARGRKGIMMVKTATQAWSIWMHEAIDISNTVLGVWVRAISRVYSAPLLRNFPPKFTFIY